MASNNKIRSYGNFFASTALMLVLLATGASALADWLPSDNGLPVDIAAVAE